MKIGSKLVAIISAVNLVCIGGLTAASLLFAKNQIGSLADENVNHIAVNTGLQINVWLETYLNKIRAIGQVMSEFDLIRTDGRRQFFNSMLENLAENNPDLLAVWTMLEPDVLDGMDSEYANTPGSDATGRFLSYFSHVNGKVTLDAVTGYDGKGAVAYNYNTTISTGREMILEPYYYEVGGENLLITSLSVPVKHNGKVIGVAGVDIALTEIQSLTEAIKPYKNGTAAVFSNNGCNVANPDPSRLGKSMYDTEADMAGKYLKTMGEKIKNGAGYEITVYSDQFKSDLIIIMEPFTIGNSNTPWSAAIAVPKNTVLEPLYHMVYILSVLGVASLGIITIIIIFITRSITRPLKSMELVFKTIGEGDFTPSMDARGKDEIGNIGRSLNLTLEKIRKLILVIKNQTALLFDTGHELASSMTETAASINQIAANIGNINNQVENQSASVTETNATMEQIISNVSRLSTNVNNQSASVSDSSSAIEQMIANVRSVTETLIKNMENVKNLTETSELGKVSLEDVAADIQEIARESESLLEINSVMENIASQTNLLSMNAAIEAAHAGEAGKGFAVVADEIRKLAENSGEQSKTISIVLKKIKESIDKISRSTENVITKFEAIDSSVKIVAEQEGIIRNAMEEQGAGSKQILDAIAQLNEITNNVTTGASEMYEGCKEVIEESKNLEQVTEEINNGMKEMTTGAEQINIAVNQVNEISGQNKENIDILAQEISRFKVE